MYHPFDCSNSFPILELSVKFVSQSIYHENSNKPLDGAYLVDFGIDIKEEGSEIDTVIEYVYDFTDQKEKLGK